MLHVIWGKKYILLLNNGDSGMQLNFSAEPKTVTDYLKKWSELLYLSMTSWLWSQTGLQVLGLQIPIYSQVTLIGLLMATHLLIQFSLISSFPWVCVVPLSKLSLKKLTLPLTSQNIHSKNLVDIYDFEVGGHTWPWNPYLFLYRGYKSTARFISFCYIF